MKFPDGQTLATYSDDAEGRALWLEDRREGIGGSDIAAIMGLSSFTSPLAVYYSKVDPAYQDNAGDEVPEHMAWGTRLEPVILDFYADSFGGIVYDNTKQLIQSYRCPILLHSPDAIQVEAGEPVGGIEVKNIRSSKAWNDSEYGMPERVYAQVQHGLYVTGLPVWTVVALVSGQNLITRTVEPDLEFQQHMVEAANKFWLSHVEPLVEPPADGSEATAKVLSARYPDSAGSVDLDYDLMIAYAEATKRVEQAEATLNELRASIQQAMGQAEDGMVEGQKVFTWKASTRNSLDTARLRREHPELAEQYNKTTPTRYFRYLG
jgi:putative phage-type endonuclease